jgi:uncharacterized membrane protein YbaN (DUF454 family)
MKIIYKTLWQAIGWLFIVAGFIGILTPIVPGIPFLAIGAYLLVREDNARQDRVLSLLSWLKGRWPRFIKHISHAEKLFLKFLKREIGK